jgi:hypothetical protein
VLITDISAVAADWMASGRPLLVTEPTSPTTFIDADTLLTALPVISAGEAGLAAERVDLAVAEFDPEKHRLRLEYLVGDTAPGASIRRFLEVCDELIASRNDDVRARAANGTMPS